MLLVSGTNSSLIYSAHNDALERSPTYKNISDRVLSDGSVYVSICKHRTGGVWLGTSRKIVLDETADTYDFIQTFIFEMLNAYNNEKFGKILSDAQKGVYGVGKYGIPALNYAGAFESVEYEEQKLSNKIIDEIIRSPGYDKQKWSETQKWNIVDFDEYFLWQLKNGHSNVYIDTYKKYADPWKSSNPF